MNAVMDLLLINVGYWYDHLISMCYNHIAIINRPPVVYENLGNKLNIMIRYAQTFD